MIILGYFLTLLSLLVLTPAFVVWVQVIAASFLGAKNTVPARSASTQSRSPSVCLLMPAHNEAIGIAQVITSLLPELAPNMRLLVVADNCTDDTARIAREIAGANTAIQVVERSNDTYRGKGYALDFGVRQMETDPPDVVIVVDADCILGPGVAHTIASLCLDTGRPIQALYLMVSPEGAGVKTRIAELAWLVKNLARPLGYHHLGMPCQLMGTGMAFGWKQISIAPLGTGHIVEDMQLGIDLTRAGTPPLFCPQALVTSVFPTSNEGLQVQRTRWEHGHIGVILSEFPRLLLQSVKRRDLALFALAVDLAAPPLSLLMLMVLGLVVTSGVFAWASGMVLPLVIAGLAGVILTMAVLLSWLRFGRSVITFGQLCSLPIYVLTKLPVYFYFVVKRQVQWVRSRRDGE